MNRHLSIERLDRWIIGEPDPLDERHLRECAECREELRRMRSVLAQFRQSAHSWSARENVLVPRFDEGAHRMSPRWVLAAAACFLLAPPAFWTYRTRERAAEARADTLLLEQVDSSIARPVPGSMEPLVNLVSWSNGAANATENGEKQ